MKFEKGQSGNPIGRPKGAKNKLQEAFWQDFVGAWETHGKEALDAVAVNDPGTFLKVAASLMPKDVQLDIETHYVMRAPNVSAETDEWQIEHSPQTLQ